MIINSVRQRGADAIIILLLMLMLVVTPVVNDDDDDDDAVAAVESSETCSVQESSYRPTGCVATWRT